MGPVATPAEVTFRAGPFTPSGECMAHSLVVRYSALDCVNDNAHRLEDADFPIDGSIVSFGSHRVYIVAVANSYPTEVLSYDEVPTASDYDLYRIDDLCVRVEVLTVSSQGGASGYRTPIRTKMDTLRAPSLVWPTPQSPPKSSTHSACSCLARRRHWRLLNASSTPLDVSSTRPMVSCRLPPGRAG
ncbi:hypothetical protein D1007_13291 [Hordeum vulgare]|nr:hypothetical protein D1007_13291 [Hordeum vulgare]